MKLLILSATLVLLAFTKSHADFQAENQIDTQDGISTPMRSTERTYQVYYAAPQFSSVITTQAITGIQLRLSSGNTSAAAGGIWPSQDLTFSDYTVQLSVASAALAADGAYLSETPAFSYGQGANLTTVRSGGLTIPAGSFTDLGSDSPNPYGVTILFSIPYIFSPGDSLVLTLSESGYTPSGEPAVFFASSDFVPGQADAIVHRSSASALNATGIAAPLFVNFISSPVPIPEPGSAGLLTAGALIISRRRRSF